MVKLGNPFGNPLNMFKNFRVGGKKLGTVGSPETHIFYYRPYEIVIRSNNQ